VLVRVPFRVLFFHLETNPKKPKPPKPPQNPTNPTNTDGITTTAMDRRQHSDFDQMRATFKEYIQSIFDVASDASSGSTAATVVQDHNIRLFYTCLSEAMGLATYNDFIQHAILMPIPHSNGVAVFWLASSSHIAVSPHYDAATLQGNILTATQTTSRINSINLRESPATIWLGECQHTADALTGPARLRAYQTQLYPLLCQHCVPGVEYRSVVTQQCEACTPQTERSCLQDRSYMQCSATRDSYCQVSEQAASNTFCNNGFLDFGEQCDASAKQSKTAACCVDSTCQLITGFYSDPACSTICGDGIRAGAEECDSIDNLQCETTTCRFKR